MKYIRTLTSLSLSLLIALPVAGQLLITEGADRGENPAMNTMAVERARAIVFSDQPLSYAATKEGVLKGQFGMDDNIYARVFLKKSFSEYFDEYGYTAKFTTGPSREVFTTPVPQTNKQYKIKVTIDDTYEAVWMDRVQSEMAFNNIRTYKFVLIPDEAHQTKYAAIANWWVNLLSRLSPGQHTVRVELIPVDAAHLAQGYPVLAEGEFSFIVGEGQKEEFIRTQAPGIPEATMKDKELEKKMQEKLLQALGNEYIAIGGVVITDLNGGWSTVYDKNGKILNRLIVASYMVKDFSGKCWILSKTFKQEWVEGEAGFGELQIQGTPDGYYDYPVLCEKTNLGLDTD